MLPLIKTVLKILAIGAIALHALSRPAGAAAPCSDCPAQVTATRLHLRAGPAPSAPSLRLLYRNDRLRVIDASKVWWKVAFEGQKGFVDGRYVARVTQHQAIAPLTFGPPEIQLQHIKERLRQRQGEAGTYTRQENALFDSLDKTDADLNDIERRKETLAKQVAALTARISKAETQASELEKQVADLQTYADSRLVAVYKLGRLGTLPLMASADSLFDLVVRRRRLERLLAYDETVWRSLLAKQKDLAAVQGKLSAEREALRPQVLELEKQKEALTRHRDEREKLLMEIKGKKSLALAAIAALKKAADVLDRQLAATASAPGGAQKDSDFAALKGLLNMPIKGTIISFYGPYTSSRLHVAGFRSGIDIAADRGEPIRAVDRGKIIYAGWFRGYGNMVIIDHGDHYCTLYAHAQEIFKKKGEPVASGEVIATVGDTDSLQGPKLHFEIRYQGKPVDPLAWIGKRSQNDDETARH
jgi:septal ring factor EnvC (AmiA/AmiB activator)